MSTKKDILLLGATGYSGRLTAAYLLKHPARSTFSLQLAGRSKAKLDALAAQLRADSLSLDGVEFVLIDVTNDSQLERAVKDARVVINTVGPFWLWGTPVVRACARNGVHYVDINGEWPWVHKIIQEYDFLATKTGAVIVPCCGFDSVPGDVSAYVSVRTLQAHNPALTAGDSTTAYNVKGGVSGGTVSTAITFMESIPRWRMSQSSRPYALSPVIGKRAAWPRFLYSFPPSLSSIQGGYWVMRGINTAIVRRTWGLFYTNSLRNSSQASEPSTKPYGPEFLYDEFMQTASVFHSFATSFMLFSTMVLMMFAPVRWIAKRVVPSAGSGPPPEVLEQRWAKITNITSSAPSPGQRQTHVQTIFKGRGDPGYLLTAIFLGEAALTLLPPSFDGLTSLAKRGGVLTPMSALGEGYIERLKRSGRIEIDSKVITERASASAKKTQ
ncbi:hypothetical protein BOTBODRAFT_101389 [Botryobasidium botryosum FD-172 SS1]|uniref:Saccharopine dehydrogenase NADP binding domain-containing protein n=1 Tax=Botryobasidium botryosum (strain FD-172 SS1) TaxID=930990 RepID=A0A067N7Z3_BOTB1|nr:hypothetical protein BOTBODRAFT_101389 [Botryobasidium botryosum FD-172 SS1]